MEIGIRRQTSEHPRCIVRQKIEILSDSFTNIGKLERTKFKSGDVKILRKLRHCAISTTANRQHIRQAIWKSQRIIFFVWNQP